MDRTDAVVLFGFASALLGLWLAWPPLAFIAGGLGVAVVAAWYDVRKRGK